MRKTQIFIALAVIGMLVSGCASKTRKVENLCTFAKVYGYVRYFHPSDEAADINWSKFSAYGAKEIAKCNSAEQVVRTLKRIFGPIAPSIKFSVSQSEPAFDMKIITPDDTAGYSPIYWQHQGVSIGMKMKQPSAYKSVRVNRDIRHEERIIRSSATDWNNHNEENRGRDILPDSTGALYQ